MAMLPFKMVLVVAALSNAGVYCEEKINTTAIIKDDTPPGTPWLPFLGLNPFPLFSVPNLGLRPNRPPAADKIKATKTEYIEVTRRQTVHPVCYTMYENKGPCLPHRSNDHDDEEAEMDMDVDHQITLSADVQEEMSSYMKPVKEVLDRNGKYLQFGKRSRTPLVEESEVIPAKGDVSTRTVLLTKLEKYTDHRVTATMVALNCYPVDPAIPRCRRRVINPIIEVPLHPLKNSIIITPAARPKSEEEMDKVVEEVKKAVEEIRTVVEDQEQVTVAAVTEPV